MYKRLLYCILPILSFCQFSLYAQIEPLIKDRLFSNLLKEERPLIIQLPKSYHKSQHEKYPVLYLLDAADNIAHTTGTIDFLSRSGEIPEMIVVGIVNTERFRDFSPSEDPKIKLKTGGGKVFLEFLESELVPFVNDNYRSEAFKVLAGHSLGGLFTLFSLQAKPGLFQAHFAFSPSLQWNEKEIVTSLKVKLLNSKQLKTFVYMNLGDERMAMREGFDELSRHLSESKIEGLDSKVDLFESETHGTTPVIGLFHALRRLYHDWRVSFDILKTGYQPIVEHFEKLSDRYGYQITPKEALINGAGYYQLLENKNFANAKQLFELNVQNYPESANTYDSLAEAYEANEEIVRALELVNKAISLAAKDDKRLKEFAKHKESLLKKLELRGD